MAELDEDAKKRATRALLVMLSHYPEGAPTGLLVGLSRLRGQVPLNGREIERILDHSREVLERPLRVGRKTYSWWKLANPEKFRQQAKHEVSHLRAYWVEDAKRLLQEGQWVGKWTSRAERKREQKLLSDAKVQGLKVIKSEARKYSRGNQLGYKIEDPLTRQCLAGCNYDLSLDDVKRFVNNRKHGSSPLISG